MKKTLLALLVVLSAAGMAQAQNRGNWNRGNWNGGRYGNRFYSAPIFAPYSTYGYPAANYVQPFQYYQPIRYYYVQPISVQPVIQQQLIQQVPIQQAPIQAPVEIQQPAQQIDQIQAAPALQLQVMPYAETVGNFYQPSYGLSYQSNYGVSAIAVVRPFRYTGGFRRGRR